MLRQENSFVLSAFERRIIENHSDYLQFASSRQASLGNLFRVFRKQIGNGSGIIKRACILRLLVWEKPKKVFHFQQIFDFYFSTND